MDDFPGAGFTPGRPLRTRNGAEWVVVFSGPNEGPLPWIALAQRVTGAWSGGDLSGCAGEGSTQDEAFAVAAASVASQK